MTADGQLQRPREQINVYAAPYKVGHAQPFAVIHMIDVIHTSDVFIHPFWTNPLSTHHGPGALLYPSNLSEQIEIISPSGS